MASMSIVKHWTSEEYQMVTYEDLYHDAKVTSVFGEAMYETVKYDFQDLQSDKFSLATPGAYILSKAIYEALVYPVLEDRLGVKMSTISWIRRV
jgi:hypothetical protein